MSSAGDLGQVVAKLMSRVEVDGRRPDLGNHDRLGDFDFSARVAEQEEAGEAENRLHSLILAATARRLALEAS